MPYALKDLDGYTQKVADRMATMGFCVRGIHQAADPVEAAKAAVGIFVGGGNTFRLLKNVRENGLLGVIRDRVRGGMPYMGSSAGSNLACPTIMTTNDMPISNPGSFDALGLVPFQINAHYIDPDPDSKHQGETREQRLSEYHEENDLAVVGLREGAWLTVEGDQMTLGGQHGARIFRQGADAQEAAIGADLSALL